MTYWEHFHVAIPTTEPPPDHTEKLTWRLNKEMKLSMSRDAVVTNIGRTDSPKEPIPEESGPDLVVVLKLLSIGAAVAILFSLVIDWILS